MSRHEQTVVRRLPALLVLLAVIVAAGVIDSRFHRPHTTLQTAARSMPIAAPPGALSSTWYCAGGTSTSGAGSDMVVLIANAGTVDRKGTVTFVSSDGQNKPVPVTVPSLSRIALRAQESLKAPFVAATVELDGGAVAAEVGVSGQLGDSAAPCASSASDHWYFAEGSTTKDASETLFLFNPFPEDAIVDVGFSTEDGRSSPQGLQGLAVHGRGLSAINVGDYVHRRQAVSTDVVTRVGRITAARLQSFDGTAGRKGQSIALGAPMPTRAAYFPEGLVNPGVTLRYQLYNPSQKEISAQVNLALEQGAAEPIEVTVPAQARVTVSANDEKRIPRQVPFAVSVTSDSPGLVVERAIDAVPPSPRQGFSSIVGATELSEHWLFANGAADDTWDEWIVVQNPGTRAVNFSVTALANGQRLPIEGLQDVHLEAGQRQAIRVGDHIKRSPLPVEVEATGPVVVERDMYKSRGLALMMLIGTPEA